MSKSYHMCIDVRGVLRNWKDKELVKLFKGDNGERLTAGQIKDELMDHLAKGHRVIPCTSECNNFDWEKGCMGHEEPDPKPTYEEEMRDAGRGHLLESHWTEREE